MNLYQALLCRIVLEPVNTEYKRVLIHARTPQSAGRLLKDVYPNWEKIQWERITDQPLVLVLP